MELEYIGIHSWNEHGYNISMDKGPDLKMMGFSKLGPRYLTLEF